MVEARPEVLARLVQDPDMAALIRLHGWYHWGLHPLFVSLVRAVAGQQVSSAAACSIFKRLEGAGGLSAEGLLALGREDLLEIGFSRRKSLYLQGIAEADLAGWLDGLELLSDDEVARQLLALKGVGRWTAEMVLIFGLGRLNVWPIADLGIARQCARRYGAVGKESLQRLGLRFAPFRSVAAWYLWADGDTLSRADRQAGLDA